LFLTKPSPEQRVANSVSSPKFSVNYLQDKENIPEEKMLNKFSSSPLFFQKTRRK